jgi:UDP-N-acetyl-D-glucosamine dehydrogenase
MDWKTLFKEKKARIGIVGLGYVGLPLAMEFCRKGLSVVGFEIDRVRAQSLRQGKSYVLDVAEAELKKFLKAGLFKVSSDFEPLSTCHAILVCVQTPLSKTKEPDLSRVLSAAGEIAKRLKKGQLVVLESTVFPGATEELVLPILAGRGRKVGRDFYLAFSPERVDPGNPAYGIANTPKVVAGAEAASGAAAQALYEQIISEVVLVSSLKAAEMVKLLENSFRAVNIALANEIAQASFRLGLDVWEVIRAAATKPFGFMPFYPGPGIGGHCIPKDPQLLTWKMKTLNYEPRLIGVASSINSSMPRYTVGRLAGLLGAAGKTLKGSKIFVLGVAYKTDSTDCRESPALDVIDGLLEAGASVSYHDAFVAGVEVRGRKLASSALSAKALRSADCVAILTAHRGVDYRWVCANSKLLLDARNATAGIRKPGIHKL